MASVDQAEAVAAAAAAAAQGGEEAPAAKKQRMTTEDARVVHVPVRLPAAVGDPITQVETPALLVDLDRAEANMRHFEETMRPYPGVRLRPHFKSHKSVDLARLQLQSPLVQGFCCQKTFEAEALAAAGIEDILLTNEVVVERKIKRLLGLLQQHAALRLSVCVDDASIADKLSDWARAAAVTLGVYVELDCGHGRCGVTSVEACVELGQKLHSLPGLQFHGIHAYHGGAQHIRAAHQRRLEISAALQKVSTVKMKLQQLGVPCQEITGGGTGTYLSEAASGVYTEVQAGSFLFNDVDYSKNHDEQGKELSASQWQFSLTVLSTVMSRSEDLRKCVTDAGQKAHSIDSGLPQLLHPVEGLQLQNGGDEHLILTYPEHGALPHIGSTLAIVPGHCDPTVNMHDFLVATRQDVVVGLYPIARGPGL